MTDSRPSRPMNKPRQRGSLKAAVTALLDAVGIDRAMDLTGRSKTTLYRYSDPQEDASAPVDVVAACTRDSGCPAVADYLAREAGGVFLAITPLAGPTELARHVGALGERVGKAFGDYGIAAADGVIDPAERQTLLADIDDIMAAGAAIKAALTDGGRDGRDADSGRGADSEGKSL